MCGKSTPVKDSIPGRRCKDDLMCGREEGVEGRQGWCKRREKAMEEPGRERMQTWGIDEKGKGERIWSEEKRGGNMT